MSDDFDPNDTSYDTEGGSGKFKDLKKPGTYLLGIRDCIAHDTTKNGKSYTRFAFVVIDGPRAGESFTDRVFRDRSAYKRLAHVCRALRITERFNPGDDDAMDRMFVGRALKSKVKINDSGYAELAFPDDEWEGDELATLKAWETSFVRQERKSRDERTVDPGFDAPPMDDYFGDDGNDNIPFDSAPETA